jgi:uncharacterized membrane protein
LFMLAALLINNTSGPLLPDLNKYKTILTGAIGVVSMLCLLVGRRLFHKGVTAAKNSLKQLNDKLNRHRLSLVKCLAIVEGAVILNILFFLFTGNFVFMVFSAILAGFMLSIAPIQRRVIAQLELDWQQQKELE